MNMILCDKSCAHQHEGYCGLDMITRLTNDTNVKCGYFEAAPEKKDTMGNSPQYPKNKTSLTDAFKQPLKNRF